MLASIPSPSANGFHIGPLFIHAYGLAYVVAVTAAVIICRIRWEAKGGDRALVYEVALWGFPAGLIGGRLYFLATSWNEVPHHWWGVFAGWKGGLGIWGGIALGSIVGLWRIHRAGSSMTLFMNFDRTRSPNFGSGRISRFSGRRRRDMVIPFSSAVSGTRPGLTVSGYLGRLAPYLERDCLRSLTPWVSRTPRST